MVLRYIITVMNGITNKGLFALNIFLSICVASSFAITLHSPEDLLNHTYLKITNSLPGEYQYKDRNKDVTYIIQIDENSMLFTILLIDKFVKDPGFSFYIRMKYHFNDSRTLIVDGKPFLELNNNCDESHIIIDDFISSNIPQENIDKLIDNKNDFMIPCIGDTMLLSKDLRQIQMRDKSFIQTQINIPASYLLESCATCFLDRTRPRMAYYRYDENSQGIEIQNYWKQLSDNKWEDYLLIQNHSEDTCLLWFSPINLLKDLKMRIIPSDIAANIALRNNAYFDPIYQTFKKGSTSSLYDDSVLEDYNENRPIKIIYPGESFEVKCLVDKKSTKSIILPLLRLYDKKGLEILYDCIEEEIDNDAEITTDNFLYFIYNRSSNCYKSSLLQVDLSDSFRSYNSQTY